MMREEATHGAFAWHGTLAGLASGAVMAVVWMVLSAAAGHGVFGPLYAAALPFVGGDALMSASVDPRYVARGPLTGIPIA